MARAHFVKAARKDYPDHGIKRGESYWWWAFMQGGRGGPKRYSKTQPRGSQLTQSEFYSTLLSCEEQVSDLKADSYQTVGDLEADLQSIRDEIETLGSECSDKLSNMPDGLQQGDSGQLLETRSSECEALAQEFDGLDFSEPGDEDVKPTDKETKEDALARAVEDRCQEIIEEVQGFNWSIE